MVKPAGSNINVKSRVTVAKIRTDCRDFQGRRAQGSGLPRPLGVAANNLDFLGLDRVLVVKFEVHILDQERPDFVAEAVSVQVTLES